jgi:hypothetical protein
VVPVRRAVMLPAGDVRGATHHRGCLAGRGPRTGGRPCTGRGHGKHSLCGVAPSGAEAARIVRRPLVGFMVMTPSGPPAQVRTGYRGPLLGKAAVFRHHANSVTTPGALRTACSTCRSSAGPAPPGETRVTMFVPGRAPEPPGPPPVPAIAARSARSPPQGRKRRSREFLSRRSLALLRRVLIPHPPHEKGWCR